MSGQVDVDKDRVKDAPQVDPDEAVTDERQVSEEVRKERIDVEGDDR